MDHTGGYFMAIAVLMALYHRNKTGEGQYVDLSCADAALTLNGPALLDYTVNGRRSRRVGSPHSNRNEYPPMAPHGIYRSSGDDQWVAIAARDDNDWQAISEVMGCPDLSPELSQDKRFRTLEDRIDNQDELDLVIEKWTSGRSPMEALQALQKRGVAAAAVQHTEDRMDHDPNTLAWDAFPEVEHDEIGRVRVEGMPMKLSETPAQIHRGAPLLGQHNEFVFGELLELGSEELKVLRAEEVI